MNQVQTITEFLRSRLAEDERVAQEASSHLRAWEVRGLDVYVVDGPPSLNPIARHAFGHVAEHIARWDPARVLAEVEAKRRILDLHGLDHECSTYDHHGEIDTCSWAIGYCSTLQVLAVPYSGHPDYNPAWGLTQQRRPT